MTRSFWSRNSWRSIWLSLSGDVFDGAIVDERPGYVVVEFHGKGVKALFSHESGGHRWQRIPPNEKRGRVHTSTVTVAIFDVDETKPSVLDWREIDIQYKRGQGPGGQHRNKTSSCVVATHQPSGITVQIDGRDQHKNRKRALSELERRLQERDRKTRKHKHDTMRREQVGSGMRGDKIRTYRERDDRVTDHRTGRTWRLRKWMRGEW